MVYKAFTPIQEVTLLDAYTKYEMSAAELPNVTNCPYFVMEISEFQVRNVDCFGYLKEIQRPTSSPVWRCVGPPSTGQYTLHR